MPSACAASASFFPCPLTSASIFAVTSSNCLVNGSTSAHGGLIAGAFSAFAPPFAAPFFFAALFAAALFAAAFFTGARFFVTGVPSALFAVFAFGALRDEGVTVLLVEQNFNFASQLGDTVAVMDNGRIVHAGTMAGLIADEDLQARLLGLSLDSHQ